MSLSGDIGATQQSRLAGWLGSSAGKFSADVIFAALSQALGRGSLILASIIISNFMATQSFAVFTYFNLTISAIAAFSTLGLGTAAARIFAEGAAGAHEQTQARMRTVLLLATVAAVAGALAVLVLPAAWIGDLVHAHRSLLACGIALVTFNTVALGALSGRGAFGTLALAATLGSVVLLGGVATAALHDSTSFVLLAVIISMAAQAAVYLIALNRLLPGREEGFPGSAEVRSVLQIAGPMFLTSLVVAGIFWVLGRIVLQQENGIAEFARYAVGLQWFALTLLIPSIVTRVFFPRIVRAASSENCEGRPLVLANAGANLLIAAGIGAVILLAGDVLLLLYGNAEITQSSAFHWFVLAAIVASPVNGLGNAIIARDPGPRHWLSLKVVWALLAAAATLHLTAEITAASAAFALFAAYCCLVPASLLVLRLQKLI
ncbi:MAG: hypothetical protein AAF441_29485 [Pseudomonadota bacterium]